MEILGEDLAAEAVTELSAGDDLSGSGEVSSEREGLEYDTFQESHEELL